MPTRLRHRVAALVGGDTTYAGRDGVGVQRLKGRLLPAYEECTDPNVTVSDAFPVTSAMACAPPVRSDPGCGFAPGGGGEFTITVSKRGVRVAARIGGLDAGCEGERLWLRVSARATAETCSGGAACTVQDAESRSVFPARPCTVAAGGCVMAGDLSISDLPRRIVDVSVLGVRVERGPEGGRVVTFHGGLRLPPGLRTP